jgi:hypothetical protein
VRSDEDDRSDEDEASLPEISEAEAAAAQLVVERYDAEKALRAARKHVDELEEELRAARRDLRDAEDRAEEARSRARLDRS